MKGKKGINSNSNSNSNSKSMSYKPEVKDAEFMQEMILKQSEELARRMVQGLTDFDTGVEKLLQLKTDFEMEDIFNG